MDLSTSFIFSRLQVSVPRSQPKAIAFTLYRASPTEALASLGEASKNDRKVAANRELSARFEQKIQATLARIWGEEEPAARDS